MHSDMSDVTFEIRLRSAIACDPIWHLGFWAPTRHLARHRRPAEWAARHRRRSRLPPAADTRAMKTMKAWRQHDRVLVRSTRWVAIRCSADRTELAQAHRARFAIAVSGRRAGQRRSDLADVDAARWIVSALAAVLSRTPCVHQHPLKVRGELLLFGGSRAGLLPE